MSGPLRVALKAPEGEPGGIQRYSDQLEAALRRLGVVVARRPAFHRELRVGRMRLMGSATLALDAFLPIVGGDVSHAMAYHLNPRLFPADVVTVHDVMNAANPQRSALGSAQLRRDRADIRRALRHSRVITDSEHSRQEALRLFPEADPALITPIHLGVDHAVFFPEPAPPGPRRPPWRDGMLNVAVFASISLQKRVDLLLEAALGLPFVHVVHAGTTHSWPGHAPIVERMVELGRRLEGEGRYVRLGRPSDGEARRLLSQADVVVQPSLDEGFGLPCLEALACGARVLASDIPPHREVLQSAARYVEATRDGLVGALQDAWDGEAVRDRFFPPQQARLRHARSFTWEATAHATLAVYREALEEGRRQGVRGWPR